MNNPIYAPSSDDTNQLCTIFVR